ncbi:MAG: MFS transporter [Anaerolineales bacterium]|nr:MFS transporter [Anaerolineales bacterium]
MRSRNVFLLALLQAIGMSGGSIVVLLTGIIGEGIAPTPQLATLPNSLGVVSTALFSIPAALLMRRIGRKAGFLLSLLVALAGAALAALAVSQGNFALLCAAVFLMGQHSAFVLQYRFAATESVPAEHSGRAVSLVLVGGILAGFLGPEIAKRAQHLLPVLYAGSFAALAGLYVLGLLLVLLYQNTSTKTEEASANKQPERPLGEIMRLANYQVAVLAGVASYGLMVFIMTATPLHMHGHGFSLDDTAFVIQSHIIAMYLPSLFSGFLIEKFGTLRIMLAGVLLMLFCNVTGLLSVELPGYWTALVLLGLGWNLLFVGGTVLLTSTYRPSERFKTQASNDFAIFAVQALSSFSAGSLLHGAGWDVMNWLGLGIMLVTGAMLLARRRQFSTDKHRY